MRYPNYTLFVGMDPSHRGDPERPLEGAIGKRFARLLRITPDQFVSKYPRINLNEFPLPEFDQAEAAKKVKKILNDRSYKKLVLCGRLVTSCFGLEYHPLCLEEVREKLVIMFPHPSGLNRWWNKPANVHQAGVCLRTFVNHL